MQISRDKALAAAKAFRKGDDAAGMALLAELTDHHVDTRTRGIVAAVGDGLFVQAAELLELSAAGMLDQPSAASQRHGRGSRERNRRR